VDALGSLCLGAASPSDRQAFEDLWRVVASWGYVLFYIGFALGSALALGALVWRRGRVLTRRGWREEGEAREAGLLHLGRGTCAVGGAMLLLILCAVSQQMRVDDHRGFITDLPRRQAAAQRRAEEQGQEAYDNYLRSQYLYLPTGKSLRVLSFGNTGLAADYIWLTSLQYVSSPFRVGKKFELLRCFYDVLLDLDPHWVEVLVKAGRTLSALDPDRERAEQFFNQAIVLNPEDHQLPAAAGYHYVLPPRDQKKRAEFSRKAGDYLRRALGRKRMPDDRRAEVSRIAALMVTEGGDFQVAAELFWLAANDSRAGQTTRGAAATQWLTVESVLRQRALQSAVEEFRTRQARLPRDWADLFPDKGRPLDAFGYPFDYDPGTGRVASRGVLAERALRAAGVLAILLRYQAKEIGRPAKDLAELETWTREYFKSVPITFPVLDNLGSDLNCTTDPFGMPWDYDPATLSIRRRPEWEPLQLYRNSEALTRGERPPLFRQ